MKNPGTDYDRKTAYGLGGEEPSHRLRKNRSELVCGGNDVFVKTLFVTTLGSTTTFAKSILYLSTNSTTVIGFTNFHVAFESVKE